jgi:hypothetical protein
MLFGLARWTRQYPPAEAGPAINPGARWRLAGLFAALSLARDSFILWAFSYLYYYDSPSYIYTWADFSDPAKPEALKRSLPYPLLTALSNTAENPWGIIFLQVVLAATATGALVYVIGGRRPGLAILAGALLCLDLNWAMANRAILSESSYMSFHLLALAGVIYHAQSYLGEAAPLKLPGPRALMLAGLLYGWTVTIRPSGVFFALPLILAYALFSRGWRAPAWVGAGIGIFILGTSLVNLWRVDHFGVSGRTGVFFGVPLFSYDLFDPANGPASAQLDSDLRACYGDPGYEVVRSNYTYYILTYYRDCLREKAVGDPDYESELYTTAYREGIAAQPGPYLQTLLQEMGGVFSFGAQNNLILTGYEGRPSLTCRETFIEYPWCDTLPTAYRISPLEPGFVRLSHALIYPNQMYLALMPKLPPDFWAGPDLRPVEAAPPLPLEMAGLLAALFWMGFLLCITRGGEWFLVLGSGGFILYLAASVVFGHVFVGRYAQPLSPFYGLLSAVTLYQFGRAALAIWPLKFPPPPSERTINRALSLTTGLVVLLAIYFFGGSQQTEPYQSITAQAENHLQTLDSPMIYNPAPYFPDPATAKWRDPAAFQDDELGPEHQEALFLWGEDHQAAYLYGAGLRYLIFDQVWWARRTPAQQAQISDPGAYELLHTWVDEQTGAQIWLYRIRP